MKVGSKSSGKQGSSWQLERHNRKNAEKGKTEPLNVSGYYANGAEMSSLEEYNQHRRATQPQWEGSASSAGGGGRGSSSNWMKQLYNEVYNSAPTEKTGGVQFRPSPQTLKRLGIEPAKGGLAEQPNRTPSISVNSEQYASTAQKYKEKAAKNPNNLMYKDEAENYKQLAERAKKFDGSKTSHSGVDAVLALGAVKKGGKVRISGIGSWADGEYTKTTWSAPGYTSGEVFKRDKDGRSFGANTGTIMSELGQIRGGKLKENGDVKVDLL